MKRLFLPLATSIFFLSLIAWGQSQPSQQNASAQAPAPTTIRSTSKEVLLDMVFRDKKGRTIRDIKPEEIHISEDGVEQKLSSFQLVEGKNPSGATSQSATTLDPMREIRLVTFVFEGLDQDGKRFFTQALKDILDMTPEQNLYFSVLTIDQRLHIIQPFTADHAALLKSVQKASMWSTIQYQNNSAEVKTQMKQIVDEGEPGLASAGSSSGPSQSAVQGMVSYRMARMQYDMLQAAEAADREYSARASLDGLMALVKAQAELPGRKVVMYFNPWLNIPEVVKEQYQSLISMANRANVSFYTVDPKGLVTWSQNSNGRDMLSGATGDVRAAQLRGGVGEVTEGDMRAAENAEGALRANPLEWLRDLARQTGGVAIAETNDYKAPFRTAMDEVRNYYEAAYVPHIAAFDGKFRKISVRVDRPNVVVNTRSGYFAIPQLRSGEQLAVFEMPLLNALNAATSPSDVAFQAGVQRFNERGPKIEYMVTVEAPQKNFTFTPLPDKKNASLDVALLAVVKDPGGEIVEKFSKNFAVQVGLDQVDSARAGNLVQTFHTELPPGSYTLEAAVMDRDANKIGVTKVPFSVPQPTKKLALSNVVVVRRADQLKDNQILDAFYFQGGKIVPTLSSTLKGGHGNVLPFYFAVYPDPADKEPVKSFTMSFYKEGQYLGASQAPLPEAQTDGRIPYIANLPGDVFTPGSYEIRIGVTQGSSTAEENVDFKVE